MKCANLVECENSALVQQVAVSSKIAESREQARNKPRYCKTKTRPPPDPEKRSPGAVGTAAGDNRKIVCGSVGKPQNTKSKSEKQAPDRLLSMYDGRVRLASITGTTGDFVVVMANGGLLGSFKTLGQASAAISIAHGGGR